MRADERIENAMDAARMAVPHVDSSDVRSAVRAFLEALNDGYERPQPPMKVWFCKIGEVSGEYLHRSDDAPMRSAVAEAYRSLAGEPHFIFSGWGGQLRESERAVHEKRLPDLDAQLHEAIEAAALLGVLSA